MNVILQDNLLIHHLFQDGQKPASKANPSAIAMNNFGKISHSHRDENKLAVTPSSSSLIGYPEFSPPKLPPLPSISTQGPSSTISSPVEPSSHRMSSFIRYVPQLSSDSLSRLLTFFSKYLSSITD